jgi:hypothetical protein
MSFRDPATAGLFLKRKEGSENSPPLLCYRGIDIGTKVTGVFNRLVNRAIVQPEIRMSHERE